MARRTAAIRRASARLRAPESLRLLTSELLLAELLVVRPFAFVLLLVPLEAGRFFAEAEAVAADVTPVNVIKHTAMIKELFLMSHMLKLSFETT